MIWFYGLANQCGMWKNFGCWGNYPVILVPPIQNKRNNATKLISFELPKTPKTIKPEGSFFYLHFFKGDHIFPLEKKFSLRSWSYLESSYLAIYNYKLQKLLSYMCQVSSLCNSRKRKKNQYSEKHMLQNVESIKSRFEM